MLGRLPIRLRLTLAFALVTAVLLAAVGIFLRVSLETSLETSLERDLRTRADAVAVYLGAGGRRVREREGIFSQVLDERGRVVDATSRELERPLLTDVEFARALSRRVLATREAVAGREDAMLLAGPVRAGDRKAVLVVGASMEEREEAVDSLFSLLMVGGPIALVLVSVAGYALSAASLRPVEAMRRRAAEISASTPGERLPLPAAGDEISQLGTTLNAMLGRLEATLERERRLVADASHEFRTPLATLKTEIELALRQPRSVEELQQALRSAAEETDRLAKLADDLLLLARAEQEGLRTESAGTNVADVFEAVAARYQLRAAEAGRTIVQRCPPGLAVAAERRELERAIANLVENAFDHGDRTVSLIAADRDGMVELHVTDEGQGFPPAFLAHAFERFRRADEARTRGGAGLGLAIVDAVARGHRGAAHAANRRASGADVWISLPRAQTHDG